MPTETDATEMSGTVSREAHQRMTDERNEYKARVEQLEKTVVQQGLADKTLRHFMQKGVDDPVWAADIATPAVVSAGEIENLGEFLDQRFARLYPSGEAPPVPTSENPAQPQVPTPDAIDPPGFTRPAPNSEGAPPGQKKYTTNSPEVRALIQANDRATLAEWDKQGLIEWQTAPPVSPG